MIRVLISGDDPAARKVLDGLLEGDEDPPVIDEVHDMQALLEKFYGRKYDLILLDINRPPATYQIPR